MANSKATTEKPPLDYCSPESWETARNYGSLIGEVPNSFSTLIRSLVVDQSKSSKDLGSSSQFQVARLLRGHGMRSVVYYAGLTFHNEEISSADSLPPKKLAAFFSPLELSVIIATTYLYRTIRKLSKSTEWSNISEPLLRYIDIGGYLGVAIPRISIAHGIVCAAMPIIAHAAFLKHDEKGFKEYRRQLQTINQRYLTEYELKRWGCTSFQVASIMMQAVGLGKEMAHNLTTGMVPQSNTSNLSEDAYVFQIADIWISELNSTGQPPDMTHRGEYYPLRPQLNQLLAALKEIRSKGSRHKWLEKTKADISPSTTPAIFSEENKPISKPDDTPSSPTASNSPLNEEIILEDVDVLDQ